MNLKTSQHILGTSANLLGFCLIVITSLHFSDKAENSLIDEFTSVVGILLTLSTFFSFLSIRSSKTTLVNNLEKIADFLFLISLLGILFIILLIFITFL